MCTWPLSHLSLCFIRQIQLPSCCRGLTWRSTFHVFCTTIDFQSPPIVSPQPAHPKHHTSPDIKASPLISLPLYHHILYRHLRLYDSQPLWSQTDASLNCHLTSLVRKTVIFLKIFLSMAEVFKDLSAFSIMRVSALFESSSFNYTAWA